MAALALQIPSIVASQVEEGPVYLEGFIARLWYI
jgi:hypothetical protein